MTDIVDPILQWLNNNPNLAGLATFIISTAESVAVIGTIIPGTVMMTAIGTLAGAGVIPFWPTLIWAALGAVVGDGISYWFGYHFKDRIRLIWPFRQHPEWLSRGEQFFHKYGGMSVFIGRFVGPVRALVPLVAGMLGMKPVRFYIANILSAILWSPIYMLPGILLGAASLELPTDVAAHVIVMLLLSLLSFILCAWLIFKFFSLINNRINHILNGVWHYLKKSRSGHMVTLTLKHYNHHKTHGQLVLAFYFILVTGTFIALTNYIVIRNPQTIFLNNGFYYFFHSLHTATLDKTMIAITLLGQKSIALSLFGIVFLWLLYSKKYYVAAHVFVLALLTVLCSEVVKYFAHSPRPAALEKIPAGFSFPSGHTTLATTLYVGLALLLSACCKDTKRFFIIPAILIAFLVGVSRLYLEAHWFTDVIGGWLLGSALLILVTISYNRKQIQEPNASSLSGVFVSAFIIIYGSYYFLTIAHQTQNYTLKDYPIITTTTETWWQQKDEKLPRYRINRFGVESQIINLQWTDNLDAIKTILLENKWEVAPERDWINVIMRLSDVQSMQYLPLVSPLYLDKKPVLVMIKRVSNSKNLIILRLWNSNLKLTDSTKPVWVGTVEPAPRTYHWILRKNNSFMIAPEFLFAYTPKQITTKAVVIPPQKKSQQPQTILLIK